MKISKLFHWLYAILMLLPFAFFVPSVLYYAFNDNATMQSVEVPRTETIAVNFNQKVRNGDFVNSDYWSLYDDNLTSFTTEANKGILTIDNVSTSSGYRYGVQTFLDNLVVGHIYIVKCNYNTNSSLTLRTDDFGDYNQLTSDGIRFVNNSSANVLLIRPITGTGLLVGDYYELYQCQCFDLTQMFGSGYEPTLSRFNQLFPLSFYPYTESELMQITYDTGETEQLISNTSIINYAWESIWDLPLFSWTKVTFVSVPFSYLTGIFGLSASNSLNYVFGYFVTISIVWLVFDLLLYVPMLAHNWIDKARIE